MGNQPKIVTLVFPLDTAYNLVLLGQKREKGGDPGSGRWNGAGGKVEPGETIRGAAVRELREEFCLEAKPEDLRWAATIDFFFEEEHRFRCHVFLAERYQEAKGVRRDGEMERILWHNVHHLPEEMWPSDRIWLVEVLRTGSLGPGSFITGTAHRFWTSGWSIANRKSS